MKGGICGLPNCEGQLTHLRSGRRCHKGKLRPRGVQRSLSPSRPSSRTPLSVVDGGRVHVTTRELLVFGGAVVLSRPPLSRRQFKRRLRQGHLAAADWQQIRSAASTRRCNSFSARLVVVMLWHRALTNRCYVGDRRRRSELVAAGECTSTPFFGKPNVLEWGRVTGRFCWPTSHSHRALVVQTVSVRCQRNLSASECSPTFQSLSFSEPS